MQGRQQVLARLGVEAHGGFIHQQHRRVVQAGAHEFHLAAVAAGEFAHFPVQVGANAHALATGADALVRQPARQAVQVGLEQQVATDAEVEVERDLLEHDADMTQCSSGRAAQRMAGHLDLALVGGEQAGQHLEQRGLAGAVGAEQRNELAGAQVQRQRLKGRAFSVTLGQARGPQHVRWMDGVGHQGLKNEAVLKHQAGSKSSKHCNSRAGAARPVSPARAMAVWALRAAPASWLARLLSAAQCARCGAGPPPCCSAFFRAAAQAMRRAETLCAERGCNEIGARCQRYFICETPPATACRSTMGFPSRGHPLLGPQPCHSNTHMLR